MHSISLALVDSSHTLQTTERMTAVNMHGSGSSYEHGLVWVESKPDAQHESVVQAAVQMACHLQTCYPTKSLEHCKVTLAAPNHGDTKSTECRDMWNIARARAVQDCDHQDVT